MHYISSFLALTLAFTSSTFAQEGVITPGAQGTAIGGALNRPVVTPPPKANVEDAVAAPAIAGPLTISVTNSFGAGLSISFAHDSGSPTAINSPTPGPLGSSTEIIYPSGWAGRINIGKDFNADGSKIEASFSPPNYQPNVDVSYVDGYTIPITCSCGGVVVTGCNIPLFHDGITCANEGPGPICYNPLQDSQQAQGSAAAPFFEPCQGGAYTYPNDNGADSGCNTNLISCCVGSTCPPNPHQHSNGKRSLIGGHVERVAVDAV